MHQNFDHPHQMDHLGSDEQLNFSTPYFLPYVESTKLPHRNTFLQANDYPFAYPVCSFPMDLSNSIDCGLPITWESTQSERKMKGAMMSKIARNIRKQARQRTRSSTSRISSILEQASKVDFGSMKEIVHKNEIHSRIPNILHSLDGKRLKNLLTKKLKTSDVGFTGRIVLPKKEAEKNLPTLSNKEGIEVVLKDVCTDRQWSMKYKYWSNNKSRMYVLENTGNFVKHYQLQIGDSITLFEDELKNLLHHVYARNQYVLPKKLQTPEVTQQLLPNKEEEKHENSNNNNYIDMPYQQEKEDEEETCLGKLIDELFNQMEQESSHKLSTMYNVGGSSSNTEEVLDNNNASQEASPNGTVAPALSSFQDDLDDFFEGLDMSQFGCDNFILDDQYFVEA